MKNRIGIIVANYYQDIADKQKNGAITTLKDAGINVIDCFDVPGAVEIPLAAKWLASTEKYDAIIAFGCVIRGETTHYDYVCEQVSQGCQAVMLDYTIPVIFGVLTTENKTQALNRLGGTKGHKGIEAAKAAIAMLHLKETIAQA